MISFETYRSLSPLDQADLLLEKGVYLQLVRHTPYLDIELYALNDFYVELYFNAVTQDPLFLRAFRDTQPLEPYLVMIDIGAILQADKKNPLNTRGSVI